MLYRHLLLFISCLLLFTGCGAQSKHSSGKGSSVAMVPPSPAVGNTQMSPTKKPVIVIDAGHGGKDLGTYSDANNYQEKDFALRTAKLVQKKLKAMGYTTVMTRSTDTFVPLPKRAAVANHIDNSLFVSLHYNFSDNTAAQGIEVYFCGPSAGKGKPETSDKERIEHSKELATSVFTSVIESSGAKGRGVKAANFSVLRNTTVPAILVEGGFLSNAAERAKLRTTRYLNMLAQGIAEGIDAYATPGGS